MGLLGRRVEYVTADGKSDPSTFAREAERLIGTEKVSVIVGCYSSASRKAVKEVVERLGSLLVFPVAYEGLEESPNMSSTSGHAPNQQIIPTVKWSRRPAEGEVIFTCSATISVWPRRREHDRQGPAHSRLGATLAGEDYVEFGATDFDAAVAKAVASKPDVILSTLVGDSNLPFYQKFRGGGIDTSKISVVSFVVAEDELRDLPAKQMINDYAICNYFQILDRPENQEFIRKFKARFGADRRTSDTIASAYNSVRLWAQAVRDAETEDPRTVVSAIAGQSHWTPRKGSSRWTASRSTPGGPSSWGRSAADGQIDLAWSVPKPIRPVPFPFSRTRGEWLQYLDNLRLGWGGNWVAPPGRRGGASP